MSLGESATPLGKVEGLGSSGHGGEHWLRQMLGEWLRSAWGAVPMALFVVTAFKHGVDGLKVAVDDYVHDEGNRTGLHYLIAMAGIAGAAVSLFALAKIAFGAPAA
jgi:succinate dehydrogenase / fumarate reductase membrane anchor subunit